MAVTLLAGIVALQVVLLPIFFGVAFPYALTAYEVTAFAALMLALKLAQLPTVWLWSLAWVVLGFAVHVIVLGGDVQTALGVRGSCIGDDPGATGLDTAAALDSFRRGFAYLATFLLAARLASMPQRGGRLVGAIAISAVVLLSLGIVAPRDHQDILWFYSLPTTDRYWLSSSVHLMQSSFFGYLRLYDVGGIPVVLDELQVSYRPVGPIFNQNQYAAAAGITLPVLLGWLAARSPQPAAPRRVAALLFGGALTCAIVYALTASRGGLIAQVVSLGAFLVALRQRDGARAYALLAGLAIVAVCVLVPLLPAIGVARIGEERASVWLQTMRLIVEHPLAGSGLGNFQYAGVGIDGPLFSPWYAAHNVYLQLVAEIGVLGLLWLAIAVAIFRRGAGRATVVAHDAVGAGLFASLMFAATHAALDYAPAMPFNAVAVAVAAGLSYGRRRAGEARPVARDRARTGTFLTIVVALLCAWLALGSVQFSGSQGIAAAIADSNARLLSGLGEDEKSAARQRLMDAIDLQSRHCRWIPPGRDALVATAHAHVLLSGQDKKRHLEVAAVLLERARSTGSGVWRRKSTQAEIERGISGRQFEIEVQIR